MASEPTDNTLGDAEKKKVLQTCYPLLRGILHIMMKDGLTLAFSCNSERINHCFVFSGGRDIHVYFFSYAGYPTSADLGQEECVLSQSKVKHGMLPETCGWSSYLPFCLL